VREKARATSCLSNLKQLGLAFGQYSQDYDEKNPNGVNVYSPGGMGWGGEVYTYVKSVQVFRCPDDSTGTPSYVSYGYNSNNVIPSYSASKGVDSYPLASYNSPAKTVLLFEVQGNAYNGASDTWSVALPASSASSDAYYGNGSNGASPAGFGVVTWGNPNTGLGGAGAWASGTPLKYTTGYLRNTTAADHTASYAAATGRHTDGSNFLMADDHAKWFRGSAIGAGITNPTATDCNTALAKDSSGEGTLAPGTECGDSTIAGTFSLN
jgi:hypothetical protein